MRKSPQLAKREMVATTSQLAKRLKDRHRARPADQPHPSGVSLGLDPRVLVVSSWGLPTLSLSFRTRAERASRNPGATSTNLETDLQVRVPGGGRDSVFARSANLFDNAPHLSSRKREALSGTHSSTPTPTQ